MQQQIFKEPEKSFWEKIRDWFTPAPPPVTLTETVTTTVEVAHILEPLQYIITPVIPRSDDDSTNYWLARRYARYAAHTYGSFSNDILPGDSKIIEKHTTYNGLKATLYEDSYEIICAFAGSETLKDWENNIKQLYGSSPQYDDALAYGRNLQKRFSNRTIVFVGHSQGGGEAAYCACNLGAKAETFNPAGLSILTLCKGNYKSNASINAYVFATDILNKLQWAIGAPADGDVHYISDVNIHEHGFHGMKGILKYFDVI